MNFTFSHLADCHLGAWRDEKLRQLGFDSFCYAIDKSLEEHVDFILIAGDLFNTALPSVDVLVGVVKKLQEVKQTNTPVYIIAGSHDYSSAGKTMLSVLEEAGLVINVLKGEMIDNKLCLQITVDQKTQVKLCGILGRANALEKSYYQALNKEHLESLDGFKIFLFHTAIDEIKPKNLEGTTATQLSYLPQGFNYYAGGHVHYRYAKVHDDYGLIVYPGPTFPNNFVELEELNCGSFLINTVTDGVIEHKYEYIKLKPHVALDIDVSRLDPSGATKKILESLPKNADDVIITLRVHGKLTSGGATNIDWQSIRNQLANAYAILQNTASITSVEFEKITLEHKTESEIIFQNVGQIPQSEQAQTADLVKELMQALKPVKSDGQTQKDFEDLITKAGKKILGI